jgi:hypothetical protein
MAKEYFNTYHSYLKSIEPLNEAERGRLFTALLIYSSTGAEPELRGNERFIFPTMKEQIDRDAKRYTDKCKRQAENAKKRWDANACQGMPTHANDAKEKEKEKTKTKEKDKAKDIEKENVKEKADKPPRSRFIAPTLEEVEAYCKERGNNIDPKRFWEYFDASGWIDSKGNKVKNWKQKVITWESKGGNGNAGVNKRTAPEVHYGTVL